MRLVLDTDVMLSAARSSRGASRAWLEAVLIQEVEIALSVPLVLEYEAVLKRPKHLAASEMSAKDVDLLLNMLCAVAKRVKIHYLWRPSLPDPEDHMVLETAIHGQADLILSFNQKDFAGAERFGIKTAQPGTAWQAWNLERSLS